MRYSADESDMPDNAVISLFGTVYIDFALADGIFTNPKNIKPPYHCCGVRLPCGRGVWIVALTYSESDIAYFWDWRAAKEFMDDKNKGE